VCGATIGMRENLGEKEKKRRSIFFFFWRTEWCFLAGLILSAFHFGTGVVTSPIFVFPLSCKPCRGPSAALDPFNKENGSSKKDEGKMVYFFKVKQFKNYNNYQYYRSPSFMHKFGTTLHCLILENNLYNFSRNRVGTR
jgi:hypothetical protein